MSFRPRRRSLSLCMADSSPPQMEFEAFRSQGGIETLRCPSQELISLLQHSDCSRWTWDVSRRGTESQAKLGRYG